MASAELGWNERDEDLNEIRDLSNNVETDRMALKNLIFRKLWPRKKNSAVKFDLSGDNALDNYVTSAPSVQNALDIFRGEWATKLPSPVGTDWVSGSIPAFDDGRLGWFIKELHGIEGMSVLELGPLEGGHTFMLEKAGAARILSIEANKRAFLKCLITKEILSLQRVTFLCGDFVEYLRTTKDNFDVCIASGVLYHMRNPVELLALAGSVSDRLFFWTHYYDDELIKSKSYLIPKFPGSTKHEFNGFSHTLYRFEYQSSLDFAGFCGGTAAYSNWLSRMDILSALKHFGFDQIQTGCEQPEHGNGPAFAVLAVRSESQKAPC